LRDDLTGLGAPDIGPVAVGRGFEVEVMIELTHKDRATVEEFERRIRDMDAVIECRRLFGSR
jgi:Lrp/AsnC family transcriptional regulator, leucine-responsive regulatory protein